MFLRHIMIGLLSLLVLLGHVPALVVGLGLTFAGDRHPHLVVALALPLALPVGGRRLQQDVMWVTFLLHSRCVHRITLCDAVLGLSILVLRYNT